MIQETRSVLQDKEENVLPKVDENGDKILKIDNNLSNISRVNDRYADLKQQTSDTLKKLDDAIGNLEKSLATAKRFTAGRDELETKLNAIREKVERLIPAAKESEKIKEHLIQLEVGMTSLLIIIKLNC